MFWMVCFLLPLSQAQRERDKEDITTSVLLVKLVQASTEGGKSLLQVPGSVGDYRAVTWSFTQLSPPTKSSNELLGGETTVLQNRGDNRS